MLGLGLVLLLPLAAVVVAISLALGCFLLLGPWLAGDMPPKPPGRPAAPAAAPAADASAQLRLAATFVTLALDEVNDVREDIRGQSVLALGIVALDGAMGLGVLAAAAVEAAAPAPDGHWPHGWWWPLMPIGLSSLACARVLLIGGSRRLR